MLRNIAERFVLERYPADKRPNLAIPEAGQNADNWALLADIGLLGMHFDEASCGPVELMVVMEAFGRGVVAEPVLSEVILAAGLLARAGSEDQKGKWLAAVTRGEAHLALAHAEHGLRYEFTEANCKVVDRILNGSKTFVIAGMNCDAYIVTARNAEGIVGLYLVSAADRGIETHRYRLLDGSPAAELKFTNVVADKLPGGLTALSEQIDLVRVCICAELVGLMQIMFEKTLEYLKVREQFGTPIGSFQALQHRMAEQYLMLEQARSLLYRATLEAIGHHEQTRLMAKSFISDVAIRLGEDAIQMHGGMGMSDELIIGHAFKRALLLSQLFGDCDTEAERYLAMTR